LKGNDLRTGSATIIAAVLATVAGCAGPSRLNVAGRNRALLTVDFVQDQTIRYRFVSDRKITLNWDPGAKASAGSVVEQSERLETVVAYTPTEVYPHGISVIRGTVESVTVTRSGGAGRRNFAGDAVETARGESFTLKVDPRGRVVDHSELESLIQEMGKSAFRADASRGRIKEPDMIGDFVAGVWFLWDAVSTVENPAAGVAVGQTWRSKLPVPTPMVMRKARDAAYRLAEVRQTGAGRIAVIDSTYTLAAAAPTDWPIPYSGRFQMSGTFGFLSSYEVSQLQGSGQEKFNIDAGRLESRTEKYAVEITASLPPMGIRANPHIRIDQTLTAEEIRNTNLEIRNKLE